MPGAETGQLTNDTSRPAATALNWNGLTIDQWNVLNVSGWDNLLVDHVPTGGAGMLEYSPTGNRLTQTDPVTGDVTTFTYDNANRLLTAVDVSGTTTYTYDANGNQETIEEPSGDLTTNTWDGENRLIQVEHPSGDIITYAYNGDGLRVLQDDGLTETRFVHDGNNVVLELDDVGTVEADFTYIPTAYAQVLSQHRDLESGFYLFDGIHNVRQLTDSSQVVTDEYAFDAWGNTTSSTGSTANSQLWKGQYLAYRKDPDAGPELQYAMHHRNYNPATGVFTAADPAKDDLNLYRYVKNNPVNSTDPSGLANQRSREEIEMVIAEGERQSAAQNKLKRMGEQADELLEKINIAERDRRVLQTHKSLVPGVTFSLRTVGYKKMGLQERVWRQELEHLIQRIAELEDESGLSLEQIMKLPSINADNRSWYDQNVNDWLDSAADNGSPNAIAKPVGRAARSLVEGTYGAVSDPAGTANDIKHTLYDVMEDPEVFVAKINEAAHTRAYIHGNGDTDFGYNQLIIEIAAGEVITLGVGKLTRVMLLKLIQKARVKIRVIKQLRTNAKLNQRPLSSPETPLPDPSSAKVDTPESVSSQSPSATNKELSGINPDRPSPPDEEFRNIDPDKPLTDPDKPANVSEEGGDAPSNSRPAGKSSVDPLEAQNARIAEFHELGAVGVSKGQLTGPTKAINELKAAERSFVDEQLKLGKDVEVIPRAETTGPNVPRGENRTPDFKIDGVVNELKTVSGIQKQTSDALSSGIASRIIDGRGQAPNIIVDARLQSGLTKEIAERAIIRAYGADKVKKGIQSIRIIGPNFDITVPRI